MRVEKAVDNYLAFLRKKGRSPSTLDNYAHYLNRFINFCRRYSPPLSTIGDINTTYFGDYKEFLNNFLDNDGLPLQRKTKVYHLIALRGLLRFLNKQGYSRLTANDITLPKIEIEPPKTVDQQAVQKLLSQPARSKQQGLRDRAILELFANLGLTVSELVNLDRDDVNLVNETIVVGRKTEKKRVIKLTKIVSLCLARYLVTRGDLYPPLFIRYRGKKGDPLHAARELRLTARSVQRMVKKYVKKAGILQNITPATLRHSLAVRLLKEGINKTEVQELLGYGTGQPVENYVRIIPKV